jgi:ankyrin repeat protein
MNVEEVKRYATQHPEELNSKIKSGWTALKIAVVGCQNIQIIEFLLDQGADLDLQDSDGWSALMEASANKNEYIVKFLLEKGANPNLQNKLGKTALIIAIKRAASLKIIELLLDNGANIHLKNEKGNSALKIARKCNQKQIIKMCRKRKFKHYSIKNKQLYDKNKLLRSKLKNYEEGKSIMELWKCLYKDKI